MKVILLQDVKALGKKGEMVEVSDGYARNFILPKKVGIEANGANLNDLKLQKANEEKVAAATVATPVDNTKKCVKCGHVVTGKFCSECGHEVAKERVCPKCGLKAEGKFCSECGTKID